MKNEVIASHFELLADLLARVVQLRELALEPGALGFATRVLRECVVKFALRLGERGLHPVAFGARIRGERLVRGGCLEALMQVRVRIPRLHELRFDLRALG